MAWARFDDDLLTNDKYQGVGVEAKLLWHTSIIYCAKNLTDGFVRAQAVPTLGRLSGVVDVDSVKTELIEANLWETADGGIYVHDYLEYNPSREEVLALKAARSEAGARGGRNKAANQLAIAWQLPEQPPSKDVAKSYPVPVPGPVPGPGSVPRSEDPSAVAVAPAAKEPPGETFSESIKSVPEERRMWAAFATLILPNPKATFSKNARGAWNSAIKGLIKECDAKADDVPRLCHNYEIVFGKRPPTPNAVLSHYPEVSGPWMETPVRFNGFARPSYNSQGVNGNGRPTANYRPNGRTAPDLVVRNDDPPEQPSGGSAVPTLSGLGDLDRIPRSG